MHNSFFKSTDGAIPEALNVPIRPSMDQSAQHLRRIVSALPEAFLPSERPSPLPDASLYLTEKATTGQLGMCFQDSAIGLIELTDALAEITEFVEIVGCFDVNCLSITSQTASRINVVPLLCRKAPAHSDMPRAASAPMELAVQEAAINALTHGNLGLKSAFDEAGDDIEKYLQIVRTQAVSKPFKTKRIDFLLWEKENAVFVMVRDQGVGYRPPDRRQSELKVPQKEDRRRVADRRQSGRGLDIIKQFSDGFWITPPGTSIVMRFKK